MGPRRMPAAEVDVTPDLVRQLLRSQHPDLARLPVEILAHGWDNVVCRLGGDLLVRVPRRQVAARLLANEQRWLPVLGPRLPLPVPVPVRVGRPGAGYPRPWSIVPMLPGRPAAVRPPADPYDAAVGLGGFLGALHTAAPPEAPVNPGRGVPLADRDATFADSLRAVRDLVDQRAVWRVWEAARAAPAWDGPAVWLHGDLHPANILVDRGRLSGVVDFGDITSGDPATDLSVAWMLLPEACHDAFRDGYPAARGPAGDDACWARARGWALAPALVFLAHSADHPQLAEVGRRTLAALLGGG